MTVASTAGIGETDSTNNELGGTYIYATGISSNIAGADTRFLAQGTTNETTFAVAAMSSNTSDFADDPVVEENTTINVAGTASSFDLACIINITEADQTATLNLDLDRFINFQQLYS
jgi:hypothetical protein